MSESEYIIERFGRNGITVSEDQAEKLTHFYSMLVERNKSVNLTAITEFKDVVDKHFIDSAILGKYAALEGKNLIDVGTGAGFPGIPLKIIYPSIKLTLLDSLNKRIVFLGEIIEALQLKDVIAIHARAEDMGKKTEYREKYDICVSRAVANLSTLVEYTLPFVKPDGHFYSYKGSKAAEEITEAEKAIKILGGRINETYTPVLSGTDYDRMIIDIAKEKLTPAKYPRTGNKPSSDPIR